jgi:predicted cupin superfamily sugar epimerase
MNAEQIIHLLGLQPHPEEGGFFAETYKCEEGIPRKALPERYRARRSFGTAIYYLLTADTLSELHRLESDEVFHFYLGDPVTMLQLHPDGDSEVVTLGQDIAAGQKVQVVVPRGTWQGALLNEGGEYALLGCTVAPGFEYADYETASRFDLLKEYPEHEELILRLTSSR